MQRFRSASPGVWVRPWRAALALIALGAGGPPPLDDRPVVWYEADRQDIPQPAVRNPNLLWDQVNETVFLPIGRFTHPGRLVRRVGTLFGGDHVPAAVNINVLDEVPNSTWFTNRIGLFELSPAEVARGPGDGTGPDRSAPWTVVGVKVEGVTPGFTVRDSRGARYLIKFDPPDYPGTTSSAHVISNRILHAAGYNVPDDGVVTFRREDLRVGTNVQLARPHRPTRTMTEADLDTILAAVHADPSGHWRALSSRFLAGKPMGPFNWIGRRPDDPNDRVNHEDRRELRGFKVFATWLCHFDTKQHNTLDMYVEADGRRFVRHHFIDFASTLGAGATGLSPRRCFEFTLDAPAIALRILSLGLYEDPWRRMDRPEGLDEVGYFEAEVFDPRAFDPNQPNATFANVTDRDGYWAAKIVSAFTDDHLRAIVDEAGYTDPAAARYVARTLALRRDRIARAWFDRVAPLDFFSWQDGAVRFHDLGAERDIYPGSAPRYRIRIAPVTAGRQLGPRAGWIEHSTPAFTVDAGETAATVSSTERESYPFVLVEAQVNRGTGWSPSVLVYFARGSGRVVSLER